MEIFSNAVGIQRKCIILLHINERSDCDDVFDGTAICYLDTYPRAAYTARVSIELLCQLANVECTTGEAQQRTSNSRTPGLGSHFEKRAALFYFQFTMAIAPKRMADSHCELA
jgi:hypothetical protein